jgi:hypothetical protein
MYAENAIKIQEQFWCVVLSILLDAISDLQLKTRTTITIGKSMEFRS